MVASIVLSGEPNAQVTISSGLGKLSGPSFLESWFITWVFSSPNWVVALSKKAALLCFLSTKNIFFSGQVIAIGIPGKPPPLPRSMIFLPRRCAMERESSMCPFMFEVWLFEMMLCVLFHERSNSSNLSSWFFCFFVTINLLLPHCLLFEVYQ